MGCEINISIINIGLDRRSYKMLHDQVVGFLETSVVFLLLTNAVSAAAAISAIRLLALQAGAQRTPGIIERKLNALFGAIS